MMRMEVPLSFVAFQHICCQIVSWAREALGHPELRNGLLCPGRPQQIDVEEESAVLSGLVCLGHSDSYAQPILMPRPLRCLAVAAAKHAVTAHSIVPPARISSGHLLNDLLAC